MTADKAVAWLRQQIEGDRAVAIDSGWREAIADCEAKLAILAEYEARDGDVALMLGPPVLRQREWSGLRLAVRLMASAYRHRAGYTDHWGSDGKS